MPHDQQVALLAAGVGLVGLMIGSFLNVVAYRLPRGISVNNPPRSHCPSCDAQINWYDNIPVVSWLALRGRCRACNAKISILYPAVELSTGLLFAGVVAYHGIDLRLLPDLVLVTGLIAVTATDLSHKIIPNKIIVPMAVVALPLALLDGTDLLFELALAGFGAFVFLLIAALVHPAGMGMGDVKLAGVMGLYLGLSVVPALLIAFLAGTVVGLGVMARYGVAEGRKHGVPFAPFLALGTVVAIFSGNSIIDWYSNHFLGT